MGVFARSFTGMDNNYNPQSSSVTRAEQPMILKPGFTSASPREGTPEPAHLCVSCREKPVKASLSVESPCHLATCSFMVLRKAFGKTLIIANTQFCNGSLFKRFSYS